MKPFASTQLVHALIAIAALTVACSDDAKSPASPSGAVDAGATSPAAKDIVDTAAGAGSFKTLVAAVQAAGLESTLRGAGPFTVFAPDDTAFGKLPPALVGQLVTAPYKTELGLILKYHVLPGKVMAADVLGKSQSVGSAQGGKLSVDGSGGKVSVNGSAKVTAADIATTNGVIHAIDSVLLPTIVDTAVGYDDGTTTFKTLVAAVGIADLGATLSGPGTYTVFAPSDAAFASLKSALGAPAFDAILADKARVAKILTYHVLPATAYAKDVMAGDATTVQGGKIKLGVSGGKVTVGDSTAAAANVVLADLPNSNGVIHVIDKVLIPAGL